MMTQLQSSEQERCEQLFCNRVERTAVPRASHTLTFVCVEGELRDDHAQTDNDGARTRHFPTLDERENRLCRPDRYLFGPGSFLVTLLELPRSVGQGRCIVRRFVTRHGSPIHAFGRRVAVGVLLQHFPEPLFGIGKPPACESRMPETQRQLRKKVVSRKKPFDTVLFFTKLVEHEDRGRPLGAVTRTESF
jgi:hypothetical protein